MNQESLKMDHRYLSAKAAGLLCLFFAFGCRDSGPASKGVGVAADAPSIVETGELQAVRSTSIFMPYAQFDYGRPQITMLEKEGRSVRRGDVVGQLDASGVVKILDRKRTELDLAVADLNKMRVDHQAAMKSLESQLQSALAALKSAEIDTQRVEYESEMRQQIGRLQLKKANISLDKARRKIDATRRLQREDLKIQQAKITQIRLDIDQAQRTIDQFTLRAPADGMIVYSQNWETHNKINVGDQIWSGNALISLPDLSRIKVLTTVNEIDIGKIRVGQRTRVRLDAYPQTAFDAKITWISQTCRRKDRNSNIKVFDVEVLIDGTHRTLKPGMTASCEFLSGDRG